MIKVTFLAIFFFFFGDDGFQNMFVYQLIFNMIDFKHKNSKYEVST